jgi:ubiquinone/menaquinone biosynthesis C-methylase UbiE
METNYSKHAAYWDWDLYDRSEEMAFWAAMAKKYGKEVLSPMCAIGQAAFYMAVRGHCVTALDYTEEMILEGQKRYGSIKGLEFVWGDIRTFQFDKYFDFCFIDGMDLHLLSSLEDIKLALCNINRHLRSGGGFGVEIGYPMEQSHSFPMRRFDPRVPRTDGTVIWKEGDSVYNAATKRQDIHQIIYVQKDCKTDSIDHFVSLQYYEWDVLFQTFHDCGFRVVKQYCDRSFQVSDNPRENGYIELVKES